MSVNARTFQILYIIRQCDRETEADHISAFIAARRKDAPALYSGAYIAPGALRSALQRMTKEGLLVGDTQKYWLTPQGSQMADLLDGLDACSNNFIKNYKELVSLAVLQQRIGPTTPKNVATTANISLDSARRALAEMVLQSMVVEDCTGRTRTYTLPDTQDDVLKDDDESLNDLTQDHTPEKDVTNLLTILEEIEDDDSWVTQDDQPEPLSEMLPLHKILQDEEIPGPYDWAGVPLKTRDGHIQRAKACGMSLGVYFSVLNRCHEAKMRLALFNDVNPRVQA